MTRAPMMIFALLAATGALAQAGGASNGRGAAVPADVVVEFHAARDSGRLKALAAELATGTAVFGGKPIVAETSPTAMTGAAPAALFVISFENASSVAIWKLSQQYQSFAAEAQQAGDVEIYEVAPVISPEEQKKNATSAEQEQQAKSTLRTQNQTLKQTHDICKNC